MELRQLRYFVAVAESGNISQAAKKIFLTQPALSRQIKALEEEIGQCLLERQAHSVKLTPAGETMVNEARALLEMADLAVERVKAAGQQVRLRVGYAPSLAVGLLSPAVESFKQIHEGARVELFDLSTTEMLENLERDAIDAAITVGTSGGKRGLRWVTLIKAPYCLAVGRNHPLAARRTITAKDVAREPVLMLCKDGYPEYWDAVTGWFRSQRLRPRIAGEHDGGNSLMTAVESGLGVALVTNRSAQLSPERVTLKPVDDAPPPLCVGVVFRSERATEKPLTVFVEELRRTAAEASAI